MTALSDTIEASWAAAGGMTPRPRWPTSATSSGTPPTRSRLSATPSANTPPAWRNRRHGAASTDQPSRISPHGIDRAKDSRAVRRNGPAVKFSRISRKIPARYLLLRRPRPSLPGRLVIAMMTIAATTVSGIRIILILRTIKSPLITM